MTGVAERLDDREADQVGETDLAAPAAGECVVDDDAVVHEQFGRHRSNGGRRRHREARLHVGHDSGRRPRSLRSTPSVGLRGLTDCGVAAGRAPRRRRWRPLPLPAPRNCGGWVDSRRRSPTRQGRRSRDRGGTARRSRRQAIHWARREASCSCSVVTETTPGVSGRCWPINPSPGQANRPTSHAHCACDHQLLDAGGSLDDQSILRCLSTRSIGQI